MIISTPVRERLVCLVLALLAAALAGRAQDVHVAVDPSQDRIAVSPYLYGKNNCLSDDPAHPLAAKDWQLLRDLGLRIVRENGGNNATKYNWQKKLSSHPDWYNNVYAHDWDFAQKSLQDNLPGVQGFWAFQLIGKVADNTQHNFNDWGYNRSQGWSGTNQNLAGGGTLNPAGGSKALVDGDPSQYLTDTSAATSTAILDHWIRTNDLHLDRTQFRYWNMDNEPEIWSGTHDDVMPSQLPAEEFMQRYFAYAKAARARFPEIKLLGPVPANEWQWYNYAQKITAGGKSYCWLEYFIKRIGEEQAATGIRLLDVLDLHYYPSLTDSASILQLHRTFFDPGFASPEANGVHALNGGWDTSINQEYIFGRCGAWLQQYLGANHGVTFSVSETGLAVTNAPVASVWYASTLGEFMKHGVEVFTPWSWQPGMYEVLHLYARYNYGTCVRAISDDETNVSSYTTVDDLTGNLTVVLVNRSLSATKVTAVSLAGSSVADGTYPTLQLVNLPATETFVSHAQNALKSGSVALAANRFTVMLPPLSITSVLLHPRPDASVTPPGSVSRLANVSVRAPAGTGEQVLIIGFVLGGTGSKQVLLRGAGPGLRPFGVTNALVDPVLTLFDGNRAVLGSNNDWGTSGDDIRTLSDRSGAFPFLAGSKDAAFAPVLPVASYSAHLEDASGGSGVALGEAYDTDIAGSARLVNVSARASVGTGDNVLIAGFVIDGPADKTVLIRGVGPGLVPYGVGGVLANPVLKLFRQGVDFPLYQNDDWGTNSYADQIAATGDKNGAFGLAANSADAALLLTLPRGSYTATVSGANGTTGVALVEVYEVQ